MRKNKEFTLGGLFAGVGGIELGFRQAGFNCLWANEFDKYSSKTYRLNHGDHLIENDIHLLQGKRSTTSRCACWWISLPSILCCWI